MSVVVVVVVVVAVAAAAAAAAIYIAHCVPPTVNCLQYLVTGSTLTAVGPFQLPATQSGTVSRISSGNRPSVWTVSDGCLKLICSLDTSAFSALEVLTTTTVYKFTYLLAYRRASNALEGIYLGVCLESAAAES